MFLIIIFVFMVFTSYDAYSKESESIDVVLVMDSSGSMKKTDPMSLRIPAAKLFISLLDKNDRASVVSFSDASYPIIPLTPVDSAAHKDQLLRAADKISSAGLFTNLYDALEGGLSILSESENNGRTKIIVLMSDGMMDVGDTDKDRELVEKIKNEMAATLEEKGIQVYAIAFTEQSDRLLLEKISKRTGGFYNLALSDKDFHLIFTSIFESLKSPDMAPMSENGFLIDRSIEEVTIVATKGSPQTQIRLNSPDGRSYTNKEKSTGIGWFVSDNFDMITIKTPAEGRWEILFSTGANNKAYIITNLKLQTNFEQLYSTFGDPLDIKIWLEKDNNVIKEQELLDKFDIYLEMTGPDGNSSKLEAFSKGDGIFERSIAPFTPGNYKLRIIAHGNTFEREKAFVFNIADAKESKEDILLKREREKKAKEKNNHIPVEGKITSSISWKKTIIQFVLINLVIGIIVFAYFKRKRIAEIKGIKIILSRASLIHLFKKKETIIQEKNKVPENEHMVQAEPRKLQEGNKKEKEITDIVPEKLNEDTVLDVINNDETTEERTDVIDQKEEAQIKEIPLEEDEKLEENKLEEEMSSGQQEVDTEEQKQASIQDTVNDEPVLAEDNQEQPIEDNKHILSQDDLNELLGMAVKENSGQDKETQIAEIQQENRGEGHPESKHKSDGQDAIVDNVRNEEMENMDKLWQEALQSQKEAETGEMDKKSEAQITSLDLEIERLEHINKRRNKQMTNAPEKSIELQGQEVDENQKDEAVENQQEDIDAIWQEAMQQQKAGEDGIKENKKSTASD